MQVGGGNWSGVKNNSCNLGGKDERIMKCVTTRATTLQRKENNVIKMILKKND